MGKKTIVVWFSCGAASAVALQETIRRYGDTHNIRVVNNPVLEEHPDNMRFLGDVEKWLGVAVEFAKHSKYPEASCETIWNERKFLSGPKGAPCTMLLKKAARQQWEADNHHDYLVLGFGFYS